MNEYREQNIKNVKSTVDVVLGIDTKIKRKKRWSTNRIRYKNR